MTSATPRGTMRQCLSSTIGSPLPCGFDPFGRAGHARHFVIGIGDGFQAAVLRMRAAGLERHHEGLAGRVHDRVRHQEALAVHALQDLEADADAVLDRGGGPAFAGALRGRDQRRGRRGRIGDAERHAVGRDLLADALLGRLVELERLAEHRLEGGLAVGLGGLAVDLAAGGFRKGAPVGAGAAGRRRRGRAVRDALRRRLIYVLPASRALSCRRVDSPLSGALLIIRPTGQSSIIRSRRPRPFDETRSAGSGGNGLWTKRPSSSRNAPATAWSR